ncbi:hypothetical protein BRADI_3g03375v3 [Brachypodium distachyon]|uniref:Uncharacterized protein n=1 Tax=Brachypodium distachyon TaxID=15368 RepID=A0A0Q3HIL6_BRADI|nr:hypothetical protein BRADI_3g03375v3 [Brachypodium distachyon]
MICMGERRLVGYGGPSSPESSLSQSQPASDLFSMPCQ